MHKGRGGLDIFFLVENLHVRYFFKSGDGSRIFFVFKNTRNRANFSLRSVDQNNCHSNLFSATCEERIKRY